MVIYIVHKNIAGPRYLDRQGYGSFRPVPMLRCEAERAAYRTGGVVEEWEDGVLVREYALPVGVPREELEV